MSQAKSVNARRSVEEALIAVIWRLPIPTAPSRPDPYLSTLGLNLLAAAQSLDHVERLSERLVLVDSTHMARQVSMDVNTARFNMEQRIALRTQVADERPTHLWVPLATHVRRDLAPVVVRSASGDALPRLTGLDGANIQGLGLSALFRMFLDAHPLVREPGSLAHAVRFTHHRSRWLVEQSILHLVERGSIAVAGRTSLGVSAQSDSNEIRDKAERVVRELFSQNTAFLALLETAANEYILTASIPLDEPQVHLQYESPLMPAQRGGGALRSGLRDWIPFHQEFTVHYQTLIPRGVDSFHVSAEIPEELRIRRFILVTDADRRLWEAIVTQLRTLIVHFDTLKQRTPKLLELELQASLSRLAEFGRRREADLTSYLEYLRGCYAMFTTRDLPLAQGSRSITPEEAISGQHGTPLEVVAAIAQHYESDEFRHLVIKDDAVNDALERDSLEGLLEAIGDAELGFDVLTDNDPRDNAGHAYWRRRSFGSSSLDEQVSATVVFSLADDSPSLAASVFRLLLAVFLLIGGLMLLLFEVDSHMVRQLHLPVLNDWQRPELSKDAPISSADALVALLLLVPGLMLARLEIPARKTVLGRVRMMPRYLAYLAVATSSALALTVAALPSAQLPLPFSVALAFTSVLLLIAAADGLLKAHQRRVLAPRRDGVPIWLIEEVDAQHSGKMHKLMRRGSAARRPCTAEFTITKRADRVS